MKKSLSPWYILIFRYVAFIFALLTLSRIAFLIVFWQETPSPLDLLKAFYLGVKFDLRLALIGSLPFLLLTPWKPLNPLKTENARKLWSLWNALLLFTVLTFYFFDFGYYAYLKDRLNASFLQFAENMAISLHMVWESYPVTWILLGFAILWASLSWVWNRYLYAGKMLTREEPLLPRGQKVLHSTILTLLVIGGLYGKWSHYPLRWSEAYFSGDRYISAMALNPIHNFVDTYANRGKSYDLDKVKKYYPVISEFLGVEHPDLKTLNFTRLQKPIAPIQFKTPPNVVFLIMESLSAHRTGEFGNPGEATPHIDDMAANGWSFRHFYTPSEGTARGIFALVTGLSDINKGRTSSRNPLIVDQNTAVNFFDNYDKYYFIGGSANWGNIRGFLTNNIVGLKLYEEDSFTSPRTDVWGISDYHLFQESLKVLESRSREKPFIAFIQTAGFHRPYTIPEDRGTFELKTLTSDKLKKWGFLSNEEYNSIRFMDFSVGYFIEKFSKDKHFKNTLFVLLGDHGLPDNGATNLTPTMTKFSTERFHTPLIFYSPANLPPQKWEKVIGQQDILASVAALTGKEFINKGLGRNIFDPKFEHNRYTFSYVYYRNPHNIFLFDEEYLVRGTPGQIDELYNYQSMEAPRNIAGEQPERFEKMQIILNGLYETAKYLLFHNQKVLPEEVSSR